MDYPKICAGCGREFNCPPSHERRNQRFCSEECKRAVPLKEKFLSRVDRAENGCWNWTGAKLDNGYGVMGSIKIDERLTHRISWKLFRGELPADMFVLHHCDNPSCVNPEHLFLGTQRDNALDMLAKRRQNPPLGERCAMAKLTSEKVTAIWHQFHVLNLSEKEIGTKFGVHYMTVHAIVTGRSWKHLTSTL